MQHGLVVIQNVQSVVFQWCLVCPSPAWFVRSKGESIFHAAGRCVPAAKLGLAEAEPSSGKEHLSAKSCLIVPYILQPVPIRHWNDLRKKQRTFAYTTAKYYLINLLAIVTVPGRLNFNSIKIKLQIGKRNNGAKWFCQGFEGVLHEISCGNILLLTTPGRVISMCRQAQLSLTPIWRVA